MAKVLVEVLCYGQMNCLKWEVLAVSTQACSCWGCPYLRNQG